MKKFAARGWVFAAALCLGMIPAASWPAAKQGFPINPDKSCTSSSCHKSMAKEKFVHAPAADGDQCSVCHDAADENRHDFTLTAEGGEICTQCHGDVADKKYKHVPVAEGECTFCHDPHQSENPRQLNFPPTSELCFNCHDEDEFTDDVTHGPVAEGLCIACHDPHASDHAQQLKAAVPDLCFGCHDKGVKDAAGRILPSPRPAFENPEMKRHEPFAQAQCPACHSPHASANYRLLAGPYPQSLYQTFSTEGYVCLMCHAEETFTEARTLTETGFRNGNLNLHYRHVNKKKGRSCKACHHHHAAANEAIIRSRSPFGERFINISKFEKTKTGGTCGPTCHGVVTYDRYDPVINAIKVSPREGADATPEELEAARKEQLGQ